MKKLFALLLLLMLLLPIMALAEAVAPETGSYDWVFLATNAGATAATLLIVQFIKLPIDRVWKIPTRAIVYVISLLIMLGARAFTEGFVWEDTPLVALNAFIVALAAMGAYELTFAPKDTGIR